MKKIFIFLLLLFTIIPTFWNECSENINISNYWHLDYTIYEKVVSLWNNIHSRFENQNIDFQIDKFEKFNERLSGLYNSNLTLKQKDIIDLLIDLFTCKIANLELENITYTWSLNEIDNSATNIVLWDLDQKCFLELSDNNKLYISSGNNEESCLSFCDMQWTWITSVDWKNKRNCIWWWKTIKSYYTSSEKSCHLELKDRTLTNYWHYLTRQRCLSYCDWTDFLYNKKNCIWWWTTIYNYLIERTTVTDWQCQSDIIDWYSLQKKENWESYYSIKRKTSWLQIWYSTITYSQSFKCNNWSWEKEWSVRELFYCDITGGYLHIWDTCEPCDLSLWYAKKWNSCVYCRWEWVEIKWWECRDFE